MIFALIGNQNCGKTTLFNQLTGSNQHVGNFPGVTVEKKEGQIILNGKRQRDLTIIDLPGIYSLSPYTSEEVVKFDSDRQRSDRCAQPLSAASAPEELRAVGLRALAQPRSHECAAVDTWASPRGVASRCGAAAQERHPNQAGVRAVDRHFSLNRSVVHESDRDDARIGSHPSIRGRKG
jgi:energy-coupling factor transporter ATP-binding protein EcfA2